MPVSLDKTKQVEIILGMQWGDEGKGKIVDLLGDTFDVVARFQGGPNAGHTVKIKADTYILHMIPSGILRTHAQCVIGNGVVVNPDGLIEEIEMLEDHGISVLDRLAISQNAHLILPYHMAVEKAHESCIETICLKYDAITQYREKFPAWRDADRFHIVTK